MVPWEGTYENADPEFELSIPYPIFWRQKVISKLQIFLTLTVFSEYSSRRTPPILISPFSG